MCLAARRLTQHRIAADADDNRLSMTENGRDLVAAGTFDVHEERVRMLDESFQLASLALLDRIWVQ